LLVVALVGGICCSQSVNGLKIKEQNTLRGSLESALENGNGNSVMLSALPDGNYLDSCINCQITVGSELTCACYDSTGVLQSPSSLSNAWACQTCLINNNGALFCQLPLSSQVSGYQSVCQGCGVGFTDLFCEECNGLTPESPYVLYNACTCTDVSFDSNLNRLICNKVTAAPTEHPTEHPTQHPTPHPTTPRTRHPTPALAPPVCESYWLNINGNGIEKAPFKACTSGEFINSNGCQYQNYCCWSGTSSTSGVCKVPNGVPVDCPNLNQNDCQSNPEFCFWDATYANSGLCQRICPGNPQTMCVF